MPLPPRQGAPFEVIEAEFVLQFLRLLLDRPPLMGELHEGAQRRRGDCAYRIIGWHVDHVGVAAWRF